MTPSLGVTPDEAQLPAGPLTHWGGHIWAVPSPVGWAIWGAFWGLGLPEEWVLGLDLSLGGPVAPLSSSPIAVNISTKWKRKKKTKKSKKKNLIT